MNMENLNLVSKNCRGEDLNPGIVKKLQMAVPLWDSHHVMHSKWFKRIMDCSPGCKIKICFFNFLLKGGNPTRSSFCGNFEMCFVILKRILKITSASGENHFCSWDFFTMSNPMCLYFTKNLEIQFTFMHFVVAHSQTRIQGILWNASN